MSKIPEGATHKITLIGGALGYRRKAPGGWEGYVDGDWIMLCGGMPHSYEPIQADPEWTGEGPPPVGLECEFQHRNAPNGLWHPTTIRFSSRAHIIYVDTINDCQACIAHDDPCQIDFRPARTPEQIAAEKRDAAIKEMQRLVGSCNTSPFAELYDYGYRLQVEK